MRPRTSLVWNYFDTIDELSAKCKICEKVYSRKGRCTTALKCHIKAMHCEEYKKNFESLDVGHKNSSENQLEQRKPVKGMKGDVEVRVGDGGGEKDDSNNTQPQKRIKKNDQKAETNNKIDDEFDSFGKYIASSLRSLPQEFSITAKTELQKTISEIQLKIVRQNNAGTFKRSQSPSDYETTSTEYDIQTGNYSPASDSCISTIKIEYDE